MEWWSGRKSVGNKVWGVGGESESGRAPRTPYTPPPTHSDRTPPLHHSTTSATIPPHREEPALPPSPPADPRSDLQLVTDLNAGDVSAFDALYYRHRDWVVRLAARFTGHED